MRLSATTSLVLSGVLLATLPEWGVAQGSAAECVQEENGEYSKHRKCWDDGKRRGHWVVRLPGGEVREGAYVAGKKQGRWVIRLPDGGVQEGPYVDGEKQGRWVLRHADGTVEEGSVVDGLREGRWVAHRPDGSRRTFEMAGGRLVEGSVRVAARAQGGTRGAAAMTREERRRVQSALAAQGFDPGPADGVFGARTHRAIKAWQASNGYAATGALTEAQAVGLHSPQAVPRRAQAPAPQGGSSDSSAARLFAAHALALRTDGLAGEGAAAEVLAALPGAAAAGASPPALWRPFFANAVVALGRLPSPAPVALYYNPLLDVAVTTVWEKHDGGYRVAAARALPGERLEDPEAAVAPLPPWTAAPGPVDALARTTAARLDAFRNAHPTQSAEPGRDAAAFAAAAADLRAALPRLVWNVVQSARWTDDAQPWLRPALAEVEAALAARHPSALVAAAPDTDPDTAAVLARLPAGFAAGLALDMVLEAQGDARLLVGSLPEDGDVYVLALCRLAGGGCALRRFVLLALLE